MQRVNINGVEIYPFSSREQLLGYIDGRSALLVAVNAEKLMRATSLTRSIINSNIGSRYQAVNCGSTLWHGIMPPGRFISWAAGAR